MDTTATCIYCGTERSIDDDLCPSCDRPWIDQLIDEATGAAPLAAPPPPPQRRARRGWVVAGIIALIVMGVYAVVFGIALRDVRDSPQATGNTIGLASTTTVASVATVATTTVPPTTTTSTTLFPLIQAVGEPIPLPQLTLGAFSLGPLEFGDTNEDALGRLVATFDQPDDLRDITEADGLCPTDTGVQATWGWLTAIFRLDSGDQALVAYRLETDTAQPDHETAGLATISGASIGDNVGDFKSIYAPSPVATDDFEGQPGWILSRQSDERTLLWGFAVGVDDSDLVTAIFSPRPCDGGPFADG